MRDVVVDGLTAGRGVLGVEDRTPVGTVPTSNDSRSPLPRDERRAGVVDYDDESGDHVLVTSESKMPILFRVDASTVLHRAVGGSGTVAGCFCDDLRRGSEVFLR